MSIEITLSKDLPQCGAFAANVSNSDEGPSNEMKKHLVTPSDLISPDTSYMRGHGTYSEDDKLHASVAGIVERMNKLISVKPLKTKYYGEIGDVVVGRILEVGQRRWKVETNSRLDSVLLLSSVNLPGGELRRKSAEDELMMRDYLQEGDLISAEVQSVFQDGALSLHTRSLKYGKLGQGCLIKVSPSLIKRQKSHFNILPCGVSVILGTNGLIFISPLPETVAGAAGGMNALEMTMQEAQGTGGFLQNLEPVPHPDREAIARVRNVIQILAQSYQMLYDTRIMAGFELSQSLSVGELLKPQTARTLAAQVYQKLHHEW